MDKLSNKVLRYISEHGAVKREDIVARFGEDARKSINYLYEEKYISSGKAVIGVNPGGNLVFGSDGVFQITSLGLSYLQEKPGKDFDRWMTRIVAIWGAITGTAALVLEFIFHFL